MLPATSTPDYRAAAADFFRAAAGPEPKRSGGRFFAGAIMAIIITGYTAASTMIIPACTTLLGLYNVEGICFKIGNAGCRTAAFMAVLWGKESSKLDCTSAQ